MDAKSSVVCQLLLFPDQTFYMGLPLKNIWKFHLVQNAVVWTVICTSKIAHGTSLLHRLHWLPLCFWVQFRVLILTFKAGIGLGYLKDHLHRNTSTHPIKFSRSILWVLLTKDPEDRPFLMWHLLSETDPTSGLWEVS